MTRVLLSIGALVALTAGCLYAQDLSGNWQGTLKVGPQELRAIFEIAKGDSGGWKASMYSIDQSTDAIPVNSVTLEGSSLKLKVNAVRGTFEGKLSADGQSIAGTWTQFQPLPLELRRATRETAWPKDPTPHTIQFVTVDKDVKLEVLDWGGSGRPLVLLTGLGDNAHRYDKFAPKLIGTYHVYGITRRGFGASSAPAAGYSADRLGDDVLAVIDSLKLNKPVLVGHSIGGEELSSVGSRHPEKVAGLIYLDAGYSYAYYDRARGDFSVDLVELQRKLDQLLPGKGPADSRPIIRELLETRLPAFEKELQEQKKQLDATPAALFAAQAAAPTPTVSAAIIAGEQKYTDIHVPILAIYALPHDLGPALSGDAAERAAFEARDEVTTGAQAKAFETGLPSAHVVRLPHANHYVFLSNESDVLREMNAFLANLPQ
ncbi:MAG: alpha/beta fold hydrolase [Bryobacteraceae bacterium]